MSNEEVNEYMKSELKWKSPAKFHQYRAYAIFGIYQFYKLSYISLVKTAKQVAQFIDQPIYEITECESFAIQSKKFYKKSLGKKDVNIERDYK